MKTIVIRAEDEGVRQRAKKLGISVVVQETGFDVCDERVLFVAQGATVPWGLVEAGFGFLEKWEAAAPLWRYGVLAKDLGGPSDQEKTKAVVRDLRLLVYGHELLFVRKCERGLALLERWLEEKASGGDERLAFLRALFAVKPIFCTLPQSWLGGEIRPVSTGHRSRPRLSSLVQVEVSPGRFVRCKAGEEQKVLDIVGKLHLSRRERQGR